MSPHEPPGSGSADSKTNTRSATSDQFAKIARVFDLLADGGRPGQREDQRQQPTPFRHEGQSVGAVDYYDPAVDPVEGGNFAIFVRSLEAIRNRTGNNRVLVAACGDGLEVTRLLELGFDVTAFDLSANMVQATRTEALQHGFDPPLYTDNVTSMHLDRYPRHYAGVSFLQAAAFIQKSGNDRLLRKAITELCSLAPDGVFFFSNTKYPAEVYQRRWANDAGVTPLYRRAQREVIRMVEQAGHDVVHTCHFCSGAGPDDYLNDYIISAPPAVADELKQLDIVHSTGLPPLETIKGVSQLEPPTPSQTRSPMTFSR